MNDHKEGLLDNLQKHLLGLDDTFQFKCLSCGKCCKNREDILLNSRDLFNIAKKLNLTMVQVLEKYCETFIGHSSRIPVTRLLPHGANNVCPLLIGNKCSVHDSKPTVCAVYPLGRIISGEDMAEGLQPDKPMIMQYILNPVSCGRIKHKHTVRSWLEMFNIPIEDEFYFMWCELIFTLSGIMRGFEEKGLSHEILELMWHNIGTALYAAYDVNRDFMEQFKENHSKILMLFKSIEEKFPIS